MGAGILRKLFVNLLMLPVLICVLFAGLAEADSDTVRIHTFAVPSMNKVNVRREPAGSIRAKIDRDITPDRPG